MRRTLWLSVLGLVLVLASLAGAKGKASGKTVRETLAASGSFTTFLALVKSAGLEAELDAPSITVLAPTNRAFDALTPVQRDAIGQNTELLRTFLRGHVLTGSLTTKDLTTQGVLPSAGGSSLGFTSSVAKDGSSITLVTIKDNMPSLSQPGFVPAELLPLLPNQDRGSLRAEVAASNGNIHALDVFLTRSCCFAPQ